MILEKQLSTKYVEAREMFVPERGNIVFKDIEVRATKSIQRATRNKLD